MAGPTTFQSANRIINEGLFNCGLLEEGQNPSSEMIARCMNRLNDIINTWVTQGLKLWCQYDQEVTLLPSKADYTFGPAGYVASTLKPARVLQGYYLYNTGSPSQNSRRPLLVLSRDEYTRLSTTAQEGAVNSYFVDKVIPLLTVYFWLTPDADAASGGKAHLIIQRNINNVTGILDTLDFPNEWFLALQWALADEMSTGQPISVIQRCMQKAEMYRNMLEDWDVEDAPTQFQPDSRMQYSHSGFR